MSDHENAVLTKLMEIEAKLNSSHVLNGGFENLVQDVKRTHDQLVDV